MKDVRFRKLFEPTLIEGTGIILPYQEVSTYMKKIALIGSTRFKDVFEKVCADETLKGNVVFNLGFFCTVEDLDSRCLKFEDIEQVLVNVCKAKIDLSDEVYVIDVDGYMGQHTIQDLNYAKSLNKPIHYYSEGFK